MKEWETVFCLGRTKADRKEKEREGKREAETEIVREEWGRALPLASARAGRKEKGRETKKE